MVIDERAYTAIKAVTYLSKRGGISNTLATARSIGIQDETLFPILKELLSHKIISIDECQPYPKLRLIIKNATAYQIISAVADITTKPDLIESFTALNPSQKSRWFDVYHQVKSYEGKTSKELNGLMLLDLAKSYRLYQATQMIKMP